ncbi:MAG TPA: protein kinase, partial [Planctomycetota bacterium]|nr:protein kinase [Planctomycetota bacterium]
MNRPTPPPTPSPDPAPSPGPADGPLPAAPAPAGGTVDPQVFSNRYRVLGRLGKGGLGEVLLAFDQDSGRQVALKIMRGDRDDPRRRRRFFAEALITSQLQHPGIVPVYSVHMDEHFYTMRPIGGNSLGRILRLLRRKDKAATEAYPLSRLVDIIISVAQAVGYAHHRGVIHGDLKPHNLMIGDYGEVLTLDWGLARLPKHLPADAISAAPLRLDALMHSTLNNPSEGLSDDHLPAGSPTTDSVNEADTVDIFERQDTADSGRLPSGSHAGPSSASTRNFV